MKSEKDILLVERIWTIVILDVGLDYDNVSVLGSYDDAVMAMQCAEKLYKKVRKDFVDEFGKGGFTADDENLSLCSHKCERLYEISVTQNELKRTEKI